MLKILKSLSKPKKEEYRAIGEVNTPDPAILVDYFEKGVWKEAKLCTAPMIIAEMDNYDNRSLGYMIQVLCKSISGFGDDDELKCLSFVETFSKELARRVEAKKKAIEEAKAKNAEVNNDIVEDTGWKDRKAFYFGKSLVVTVANTAPKKIDLMDRFRSRVTARS